MRGPGKRIRDICAALEESGPMTAGELQKACNIVDLSNAHKYCMRAADLGLLIVNKGSKNPRTPDTFKVVMDWEDRIENGCKDRIAVRESKWHGVNSVFAMGGL